MSRIGITGHQKFAPNTEKFIADRLQLLLTQYEGLVGITSLAAGADQLFARTVLMLGGTLEVIVPAKTYRETFSSSEDLAVYDALLVRAARIEILPFIHPSEEAFMAAGREVVRQSDTLIAVWDGQPS